MIQYFTDINDRPFNAIKARTKKIEGRTITTWETIPLKELKQNDIITFTNNSTTEKLTVKVEFVHHYPDVTTMLTVEKITDMLSSSPKTVEHGVVSYNLISEYRTSIPKYGIYAIGISPVTSQS